MVAVISAVAPIRINPTTREPIEAGPSRARGAVTPSKRTLGLLAATICIFTGGARAMAAHPFARGLGFVVSSLRRTRIVTNIRIFTDRTIIVYYETCKREGARG